MFHKKLSIVENTNDKEVITRLNEKFDLLQLGRRFSCGMNNESTKPMKTVLKNNKLYHIAEAYFLGLDKTNTCDTYTITRCFIAERNGKFATLMFMTKSDKIGLMIGNDQTEAVFNHKHYTLPPNIDIFNIYEMRFELRKNQKISNFIDNFIITSNDEREQYRQFEAERLINDQTSAKLLSKER